MSTRQLKLIDQINELTLLRAFGPENLCLTLHELRHRNISPFVRRIDALVDQGVKLGIVHYKDAMYEERRWRDEDCTVTLVKRIDASYTQDLTEKIKKAKLPAKNRVCAELYGLYCDAMSAELDHVAKEVCRILGDTRYSSSNSIRRCENYQGLTLQEMTGFMSLAVKLSKGTHGSKEIYTLLALTNELMNLGDRYQFKLPALSDIKKSNYIQNQIFLDDYLYKGEWRLDQPLFLPLFEYKTFRGAKS